MENLKKKNHILALVLARKNSKRLKNKNIRKLGRKLLINITLDNLKKVKHLFSDIVVYSDCNIVEKNAKKKKLIFFKRPKNLSLDKTSSVETAISAVKKYENKFRTTNYIILFQPTSPFRKNSTIKKIIKLSKKYPKAQIVTVDAKNKYNAPNGVLYLTPKDILFNKKSFSYKNFKRYKIKSFKEGLDINYIEDFELAKKIIKKKS
jgi:CMP-N-acetylneuraminic acid synthetase